MKNLFVIFCDPITISSRRSLPEAAGTVWLTDFSSGRLTQRLQADFVLHFSGKN